MSRTAKCQTDISDQNSLVEAIDEILGPGKVTVRGDMIVITGSNAYYAKNKDGKYELVYDTDMNQSYELVKLIPRKIKGVKHDPLAQIYAKNQLTKAARRIYGKVASNEIESDGTIKLKLKVTHY